MIPSLDFSAGEGRLHGGMIAALPYAVMGAAAATAAAVDAIIVLKEKMVCMIS